MRLTTSFLSMALLTLTSSLAPGAEHKYLKAFPKAEENMQRHVIILPEKQRGEEDDFRVELIVGTTMLTDGVNNYRLGGTIQDQPLKGWGFTYYEVKKLGQPAQTLIGVPPTQPPVEKFVNGPSKMIRYNSRLPIVIYVPTNAEVKYRIWKAGDTANAQKG